MDVTLNLKRRRDSGEDHAKKHLKYQSPCPNNNPRRKNPTPRQTHPTPPPNHPTYHPTLQKIIQPALLLLRLRLSTLSCLSSPSASSRTLKPSSDSFWEQAATQPNKRNFRDSGKNAVGLTHSEQIQYLGSSGFVFDGSGGHFGFPAPEDTKATAWPGKKSRKKSRKKSTQFIQL